MDPQLPDTRDIASVSKLLFGNRWRLPVAAFIAEHQAGVVTVREIARELGCSDSVITPVVQGFHEAGLLDGPERDGREVRYTRLPHVYWELTRSIVSDLQSLARTLETGL
jgi:predicted transcriptional regulator